MIDLEMYHAIEKRVDVLPQETRDRLLYQLIGVIASNRCMDISNLHSAVLNLEITDKEF